MTAAIADEEQKPEETVVNRPRFGRYSLGYVIQLDCTG